MEGDEESRYRQLMGSQGPCIHKEYLLSKTRQHRESKQTSLSVSMISQIERRSSRERSMYNLFFILIKMYCPFALNVQC